jgi:hypothetical protein
MCASLAIMAAGLAVSSAAGSAFMSIRSAEAQKKQAQWEAQIREKELINQRETARVQTLQKEVDRSDTFNRSRSAAMAALGASGLGEHISFFNSIDPEAQKSYLRDVRALRLNLAQQDSTIADQVKVSEFGSKIAGFNSQMSKIGAIADFVKTAAQAAGMYGETAVPKGAH